MYAYHILEEKKILLIMLPIKQSTFTNILLNFNTFDQNKEPFNAIM